MFLRFCRPRPKSSVSRTSRFRREVQPSIQGQGSGDDDGEAPADDLGVQLQGSAGGGGPGEVLSLVLHYLVLPYYQCLSGIAIIRYLYLIYLYMYTSLR